MKCQVYFIHIYEKVRIFFLYLTLSAQNDNLIIDNARCTMKEGRPEYEASQEAAHISFPCVYAAVLLRRGGECDIILFLQK